MPILSLVSSLLVSGSRAAISAIHVYWAFGGSFPARSREDLGPMVVGTSQREGMPSRAVTVAAAGIFLGAGLLPLVASGLLPSPAPLGFGRVAGAIMVGVFLARGAYGYFDTRFRPETIGTPFESLNRRFYSPLCFGLAVLSALAVAPAST